MLGRGILVIFWLALTATFFQAQAAIGSVCSVFDDQRRVLSSKPLDRAAQWRLNTRGQVAMAERRYEDAEEFFKQQMAQAQTPRQRAEASFGLGLAQFMLGDAAHAYKSFVQAKSIALAGGFTALAADSAFNLGLLALNLSESNDGEDLSYKLFGNDPAAESARLFIEAKHQANKQGNWPLILKAGVGSIRAYTLSQAYDKVRVEAEQLLKLGRSSTHLLQLSDALERALEQPKSRAKLQSIAQEILTELRRANENASDQRVKSSLAGASSKLSLTLGEYAHALTYARQALQLAEDTKSDDLRFRWLTTIGTVHLIRGDKLAAKKSFEAARDSVERVRANLPQFDPSTGRSIFRDIVGPIYISLANLYLDEGSLKALDSTTPDAQTAFKKARSTIEVLKQVEAEQLFQDECVSKVLGESQSLEQILTVDRTTAAVYPVLIPGDAQDRLVLLVSRQGQLTAADVKLPKNWLRSAVRKFRDELISNTYDERPIQQTGSELYDLLVRPIEPHLKEVNTLVFIPDGPLRLMPWAALYDGRKYLIEKIAVANSIGISLTAPAPISTVKARVLAGGLSEDVTLREDGESFSGLADVGEEIEAIKSHFPNSVEAIGGQLTKTALKQAMEAKKFTIVHLATHAKFRSSLRDTFLVSGDGDGKISIEDLGALMRPTGFGGPQVELLSLSACETAVGNDKAALGLAGAALQSGARSVVATLWPIAEGATPRFFDKFYERIGQRNASKAQAVRDAQLALLNGDVTKFSHPHYWAPFVVIGNWQ